MDNNQATTEANIKEAIVRTIAFFDLFDYPLTDYELWQQTGAKCPFIEFRDLLQDSAIEKLGKKSAFYFWPGRSEIVSTRMKRYYFTDRKMRRAVRVARLFKLVPWIKLIAVGNMIGAHNLKDEGDIDFFIITESKRIWISRFACALMVKLLGLRPGARGQKNKICLSFFVSEDALDLRGLMLADGRKDEYFVHWLSFLAPIFARGSILEEFVRANGWLKEYLPNWQGLYMARGRDAGRPLGIIYHDIVDLFCGGLEDNFRNLQRKIMPRRMRMLAEKGADVVANDSVLKLHVNDRRREYREKWDEKLDSRRMEKWILK